MLFAIAVIALACATGAASHGVPGDLRAASANGIGWDSGAAVAAVAVPAVGDAGDDGIGWD